MLTIITLSNVIMAQTKRGSFMISGGSGITSSFTSSKSVYDGKSGDETTGNSLSILPSFGYFVLDNIAVGLAGNFSHCSSKSAGGDKDVINSIQIIPTALYFFPAQGKIRPIAQVGIGIASMTYKYIPKTGSDDKSSATGPVFNVGAGIAYFIKENISFNFGLSYTHVTLTSGDDSKSKQKQGNFGSNIGISLFFQ